MPDQVVIRDLPPLSLRAAFVPASLDTERRTIDVTWSTGARVLQSYSAILGIWEPFYEELSLDPRHVRLDRLNNSAPLLDGHPLKYGDPRAANVRGVVVPGTATVDGKVGTATVRFDDAANDPLAEQLFRKVGNGIVRHVSVTYRSYKAEKTTANVTAIPVYRVIDWEPVEISTVCAGSDDGAVFRSAESHALRPCEFIVPGAAALAAADADRGRALRLAQAGARR